TNASGAAASSALVQPDGSFSLVVLPGPGVLCVAASPRNAYEVARVDEAALGKLFGDRMEHGGTHCLYTAVGAGKKGMCCINKYHTLTLINPDERPDLVEFGLTVRPARTLEGVVVGPDGKPLTGVRVVGLTAMPDDEVLDGASFTVRGLNPSRS